MKWFGKRKAEATFSAQQVEIDAVKAGLVDGTVSTEEAARAYLRILYPSGEPVRGSFGDWDRSLGRCHHLAPYPGCTGGCNR